MLKSKLLLILIVSVFLAVTAQSVFAAKTVITFSHENAVGSIIDQTANKFKELLETKTDQVEVRIHPAAQLGDDQQNMEGLKLGTIQMTMGNPDYLAKRVPEFVVFTLPFIFNGWDHVEKAMESDVADELDKMLVEQKGIRNLMWGYNGFRVMATVKKPIFSMDDYKGMKFRSPAIPVYVETFKAIGANPTPVPWPEAYNALKMGMVDGLEGGPDPLLNANIFEVAKYVTKTNHLFTAMMMLIDDKFYQKQPDDVRKAIDEAAAELEAWQRDMVRQGNSEVFNKIKAKGVPIIEIDTSEMVTAVKPVWEKLASSPKSLEFAEKISAMGN